MKDRAELTTQRGPSQADREGRRKAILDTCPSLAPVFRRTMVDSHAPGLGFGIVYLGELIYSQCLGVREVVTLAPVREECVFRIASMTKSFVALAILQLRDAGKLQPGQHRETSTHVGARAAVRALQLHQCRHR